MDSKDTKTVELLLNSADANRKLDEINNKLEIARAKKEEAFENGNAEALKVYSSEVRKLERRQAALKTRARSVTEVLRDLDHATPDKLNKTIKEINRELNSGAVERGSRQWDVLTESMRRAKAELKKINKERESNEQSFTDRLKNWGDYWVGFAATAYTAIQGMAGIKDMMRSSVQEFAAMKEHEASVIKYTGMTSDEVNDLNKSFMAMDTRTVREKLNDLAGDAGRLGIQGKQNILDFVDAADQIKVALGEDLGENAVRDIGKLAQLFGDSDRLGLKKAMLSTGSLINDLAQSSSASESYLMDFTARLAGVGHQAGMTQAQVMAFGSILDQNMVNVEKAATALQNVITGLYTKPAELARLAGIDTKKFIDLLKTDGNAALIQFIQALHNSGGLDKLAPTLDAMKLSGAGVTQVLSALATNVDSLRTTQEQATDAFEKGTSVTNEFNTANSTVQATLDKNKKKFHDNVVLLGEQLMPVVGKMIGLTSTATQFLIKLIPFIKAHGKELLSLTAIIGAYTIAVNAGLIKTKLVAVAQSLWNGVALVSKTIMQAITVAGLKMQLMYFNLTKQTDKGIIAQRKLNAVMLRNPYAIVAASIIAICSALYLWAKRTKELNAEQKLQQKISQDNADINKAAADAEAEAINRTSLLTAIIHDNSRSLSDRREAIEALRKIVPGYNATISDEGRLTRESTSALNDYISALKKTAMAKALVSKTEELTGDLLNLETTKSEKQDEASKAKQKIDNFIKEQPQLRNYVNYLLGKDTSDYKSWLAPSSRRKAIDLVLNYKDAVAGVDNATDEINSVNARIEALGSTARKLGVTVTQIVDKVVNVPEENGQDLNGGTGFSGNSSDDDSLKKRAETIKLAAEQDRLTRQTEYENGLISHRVYTQKIAEIDVKMYESLKSIYKVNSAEFLDAEKKRLQTLSQLKKQQSAWSVEDLNRQYELERSNIKENYIHGLISEKEYHKHLIDANLDFLKKKAEYYRHWGMNKEAEEAEAAYEQASQEERLKRQNEFWEKVATFKKDYVKKSAEEQKQYELLFAEELYKKKILSEEEYQKAIKAIADKYKKQDKTQNAYKWEGGSPTDPLSQGVIGLIDSLSNLQNKLKEGTTSWQDWAAVGVNSLSLVSAIANSVSQLIQANIACEEKKINERYDSELKNAKGNKKKTKKLEEARQKELATLKSKYAKRQMAMQITQAVASTAQNALMAYGSVLIPGAPWTFPLATIAAAAALASGMIQVAAIKKQAAAQQGYYQGGFTGGDQYKKEAGVVHQGEFVANHVAVANPNLLPIFRLIDQAQQNNTIGSLTAADVSRSLAAPMVMASGNAGLVQIIDGASARTVEVLEQLSDHLKKPAQAYVVISGPDGLDRKWTQYKKMKDL